MRRGSPSRANAAWLVIATSLAAACGAGEGGSAPTAPPAIPSPLDLLPCETTCGTGYCVDGACVACVPGDHRCGTLYAVEVCAPDGSGWTTEGVCAGARLVCHAGACIDACDDSVGGVLDELCLELCTSGADQGYHDWDADGGVDCACGQLAPPPLLLADDDDLPRIGADPDQWDFEVEWTWEGLDPLRDDVVGLPAVGLGPLAQVGIALHVSADGFDPALVLLDPATGTERWVLDGFAPYSGAAFADANADGDNDIIAVDAIGRPTLLDWEGQVQWVAEDPIESYGVQPLVADLEADGSPELIVGRAVLDGATGALRFALGDLDGVSLGLPAIGDLDLDGLKEIYFDATRYEPDGSSTLLPISDYSASQFFALADLDGAPGGELVVSTDDWIRTFLPDGTITGWFYAASLRAGPPCMADFDGDGAVEIVKPGGDTLSLFDPGTLEARWTQPTGDLSGLAGCSGFDFDGDGAYEVVYADERVLRVYDGATGTPRVTYLNHASSTIWAYPVVADVDRDGSVEILVVHDQQELYGKGWEPALTVLGHPEDGWEPSAPDWPVHDYDGGNVLADGSVPVSPTPPWVGSGDYRARPGTSLGVELHVAGTCWRSCGDDPVLGLAVHALNSGAEQVAGVTIRVRGGPSSGVISETTAEVALEPKDASEPIFLEAPMEPGESVLLTVLASGVGGQAVPGAANEVVTAPDACLVP